MKLQEVHIQNYKSIKKCSFVVNQDFLALVGENDVGKSNIIDALNFFFHKPSKMTAEALLEKMHMHDTNCKVEVCCIFGNLTDDDRTNLSKYVLGQRIAVKRTAEIENDKAKTESHGATAGNKSEDYEWSSTEFEGFKDTNQRNMPEFLHVPAIRDVMDETTKKSDLFGQIISAIVESIPTDELTPIDQAHEMANKLLNFDGTGDDKRHPTIKNLEADLSSMLSPYKPSMKTRLAFSLPNYRDTGVPEILFDDGVLGAPSSKGHGFQSLVFFSMFRLYAKYMVNSTAEKIKPLIFAIDEPEIYLHPTLQRTLFRTLQDISKQQQFIISTHSPNFVDMTNYETVAKVARNSADGTTVRQAPLNLVPTERKERLRIFSRFSSERNEMFFCRKAIFVEGDGDKYATLCSADFMDKHLDSLDIVVVQTNGKQNIEHYVKIANAFGIPFAVAYDSDPGNPDSLTQSQHIDEEIRRSPDCMGKVIFEPSLEAELGRPDTHMSGIDVLEHFEQMDKSAVPAKLKSLIVLVAA